MEIKFNPEQIQSTGQAVAAKAVPAVTQAQNTLASAAVIRLPKMCSGAESALNNIIRNLSADVGVLSDLANNFADRMNRSATLYAQGEADNAQTAASIHESL